MTFERYPELDTLLLANPGAVRDYKPEWGWDRYMVGGKMFAALLTTADDCAPEYQNHPMLTVKVAPEEHRRRETSCSDSTRISCLGIT